MEEKMAMACLSAVMFRQPYVLLVIRFLILPKNKNANKTSRS
jgi:hypothetical protein